MSHFPVLVITDQKPTEVLIAGVLQPWHEFERTGIDDEYVVDVDKTEEALAKFAKAAETSVSAAMWISSHYGWPIAKKISREDAKHGFIEVDDDGNVLRCVHRTNPNKKWDRWIIGGHWSGLLRLKESAAPGPIYSGALASRVIGQPLATDIAIKRDLDVDAMRADAMQRDAIIRGNADAATDDTMRVFAVVRDGDWFQHSLASAANEKSDEVWHAEFAKMIDGLPDTAFLTVVDCHI